MTLRENIVQRRARLPAEQQQLLDQRLRGSAAASADEHRIGTHAGACAAPLAFAQQRLWFLDQLSPGSPAYNMAEAYAISGPLDLAALQYSIDTVEQRHEALRTTFAVIDGQPVQRLHAPQATPLHVIDLGHVPPCERQAVAEQRAAAEALRPFDLGVGPLWRGTVLRFDPHTHVILITIHHIICDGWSWAVLMAELSQLYDARVHGRRSPLAPLPIQYADFARWQHEQLHGPVLDQQLAYWRAQLADLPTLALPADYPRPPVQSFRGGTHQFSVPKTLTARLREFSQREAVTLFMTLLAGFVTLLHRYTGQSDLVVGSGIANRNRRETEGLIGCFANTLVLRTDASGQPTFRQLLGRVREVALGAYAHQDLPFEQLVQELQPARDLSRNPLFQVMFILQNVPEDVIDLPGLTTVPLARGGGTTKFDIWFSLTDGPDGLAGIVEYSTDLFAASTIERLVGHFVTTLESALAAPNCAIAEVALLDTGERQRLLTAWNATSVAYPPDACLHHLIEAQVARSPSATALVFDDQELSYLALNRRANRLAHVLQARGVGPHVLVGICAERSLELVIGLLAILKVGGAYVPIDPAYPTSRVSYMLEDSGVAMLLTQRQLAKHIPATTAELIFLDGGCENDTPADDQNPSSAVTAGDPAYMIYTSGSTGSPKGAINGHQGICNRLLWMQDVYDLDASDCVLQKTPFSFDVSVWEFFWPLMVGARLVLAQPEGHRDSAYLVQLIVAQQVTTLHFVPSMLKIFLEEQSVERCTSLRRVFCSGEALPIEYQDRFFERLHAELHNLYGPTEAAVDVTYWPCARESDRRLVPIGYPIANTQIYLLDQQLEPVAVGLPGELYIGGSGLAHGYHKRPSLTAEKFVPNPFSAQPGLRLYRTGDRARYLADGSIDFLGRLDTQTKIRGLRIELGEIETALRASPLVRDAAVVVCADLAGDQQVVAYVVPAADQRATGALPADRVAQWQMVFDDMYRAADPAPDPSFNIAGWTSSYTEQPLPAAEMTEWVAATVARLRAYQPQRALEIGCGSGLLLFQLAPACTHYCGTDIAPAALATLRQQLDGGDMPCDVTLLQRPAHDFHGLPHGAFDLVVVNSVAQYFPDLDYLLQVIAGAIAATAPGGTVFIGDVRSLPLLAIFHTAVAARRAAAALDSAQLRQRVRQRHDHEQELAIDPAFFRTLHDRCPRLSAVEVRLKRGTFANEMNQFRYDVALHVEGESIADPAPPWCDWQHEAMTLARVSALLAAESPMALGFTNVPNARIAQEASIYQRLQQADCPSTVGALLAAAEHAVAAVDPEALWALGARLGYTVEISSTASGACTAFDVLFHRAAAHASLRMPIEQPAPAMPLDAYSNNPLRSQHNRQLAAALRSALKEQLPGYMIPAVFVAIDALPLSPNGKLDRRLLPNPGNTSRGSGQQFVAPRTTLEAQLAAVWAEVLGLAQIGVDDNFFDLGGDSFKAVVIVRRITQPLGITDFLKNPTIRELAAHLALPVATKEI